MNQVIENIKKRRSVRDFKEQAIPRETLETLLDAARWAPSGVNTQPWRFAVVESPAFRKKLLELGIPRYKKWLATMPPAFQEKRKDIDARIADPVYYGATAIVFVIGKGMTADFDCSMACQNIMLAARSLDIGSCWVYIGQLVLDDKEIREALALQEGEKVYGPIVLGYPKDGFPEAPDRNPLNVKWL